MNINLSTLSSDSNVAFDVASKHFGYAAARDPAGTKNSLRGNATFGLDTTMGYKAVGGGSTKPTGANGRFVAVKINSDATSVTLSLKPAVIEREERQRRLNESVKLGFLPPKRSTSR